MNDKKIKYLENKKVKILSKYTDVQNPKISKHNKE